MLSTRVLVFWLAAGILVVHAGSVPAVSEGSDEGVVTAVYDGDTIRVRLAGGGSEKVRLIGVDAPEMNDERSEVRFLAFVSKRFAFTTLYREKVTLTFDWERRDAYGRLLAYVSSRHGQFNELIIRLGFASAYLKFPYRDDYRRRFQAAEREAREKGKGMWRPEPYPMVDALDAGERRGQLVRVRFFCTEVEKRGRLWFLRARGSDFSALIDQRDRGSFPRTESLIGEELVVVGLVEDYQGRPQLFLSLPTQLRVGEYPIYP